MDLSKLPENPSTAEERAGVLERLKRSAKDYELAHRNTISTQVLAMSAEQVRKLTFSLAYVLAAHLSTSNAGPHNESDTWTWLRYFLDECDPTEIRWCDEHLEFLSRVLADNSANKGLKLSLQAAGSLLIALKKRTSGAWGELTTIHADLLQRFFYYSGIAYCAMQRFKDANHAFCECLTLPAKDFGAVHMEAYKKYVLTSLISQGKLSTLPRYTSNPVRKIVTGERSGQDMLAPYQKLATAFEKQDSAAALGTVLAEEASASEFQSSGNAGLVAQVVQAYWKHRIVQLTGTYLTMGLADIAKAIGQPVDRTELQVLKMIQSGEIRARLDQRTGTVRFLADSEDVEEQAKAASKIEAEIAKVTAIAEEVRLLDTRLSTSKTYISRLTLRSGGGGVRDSPDPFSTDGM